MNNNGAIFRAPRSTHLQSASPGGIHLLDLCWRRYDFRIGRKVWPGDVLTQIVHRSLGTIEQMDGGINHLAQVVGRNVRCHPYGDTGSAIEQQVWNLSRQNNRLFQGPIKVWLPIGGALTQFSKKHLGITRQSRLGVAHGGKRLGIIRRTPVPLTINQGIAVTEVLSHQHHRLVGGAVTMGMEFTDHVANCTR